MSKEVLDIARSFLPAFAEEDSKKSEYLGYRLCNFSRHQAIELTGIHPKTLSRWKEDANFALIDGESMSFLRTQLANDYLDMQFTRNFHLVLQKDFRILYKDATTPHDMLPSEVEYLNKIRQHYTPQSLAMVKQMLSGGTVDQPFDFTKITISVQKETQQIKFEKE